MGSGCGSWPNPSCLGARAVEHDGNRINPMKSARYLPRLDAAESDSLDPTAHAPPRRPRTLGATGARRRCSHCQTAMGSRHHPSAAHAGRRRAALLLSADCARPEPGARAPGAPRTQRRSQCTFPASTRRVPPHRPSPAARYKATATRGHSLSVPNPRH